MAKKVTVVDSNGSERQMYLQETGSAVSRVSTNEKGGWKTEENVFNSSIKEFQNQPRDPNKEYFDTPQLSKEESEVIHSNKQESKSHSNFHDDDKDDNSFNSSNSSDDWESNCGGADVPDYIQEGTAYFDEEGNYSGGTMASE